MIDQFDKEIYKSNTPIELNIPNLLNYARFCLLIIVMRIMSTSPLKSFMLAWLAGSLDMLDGYFARKYNHISKFGTMLDFGMDRLTTMMQFFYLASAFPKYWFIFLLINSVELIRDILISNLNLYRNFLNLLEIIKSDHRNDEIKIIKIEESIYDNLGLKNSNQLENLNKTSLSSIDNHHLTEYLNFYIWYSSDIFFWLIYFASFISPTQNSNNNNIRMRKLNFFNIFKSKINKSLVFFDEMAKFVQNKFIYNKNNNNNLKYNFNPIIKITIACLIKFIIYSCLIGSLLRFLTNLNSLKDCLLDIIQMDYKKIQLASS
jgi:hypothetical protein